VKRILPAIECALVLLGITSLAYVGYVWWKARSVRIRGSGEISRVITGSAPKALPEGAVLGEIEIPRIRLFSMILEGTEPATSRKAVGDIRGTALPGQAGNVAIAGHRDTFFRPLRDIRIGDEVIIKNQADRLCIGSSPLK
jgi:sortase A